MRTKEEGVKKIPKCCGHMPPLSKALNKRSQTRRFSALEYNCRRQRANGGSSRRSPNEKRDIRAAKSIELMPQKCGATAGILVVLSASLGMVRRIKLGFQKFEIIYRVT